MGEDRLCLSQKILTRLRGTNFFTSSAYFAPSKANKQSQMYPNRTKHTKTRVLSPIRRIGCVRCVKFIHDLVARTFAPVSLFYTEFLRANQTVPNAPKLVWNAPKHEFRVQWGWIGCVRCEKFQRDFVARTFAPVWPVLHWVPKGNQTVPNAPK